MYQAGYYPTSPAYNSNPNPASHPQTQNPYGTAQQGYPNVPPPAPGAYQQELEFRYENPCSCFCGLATAAKILAVVNLLYLMMEGVSMVDYDSESGFFFGFGFLDLFFGYIVPLSGDYKKEYHYFYNCKEYVTQGKSWFVVLYVSSTLSYLLATVGFIIAVFANLGTDFQVVCSNVFMGISFGYAVLSRLLFAIDLATLEEHCTPYWAKLVVLGYWIAILWMFNGFVARAYRNMVERRSKVQPCVGPVDPQPYRR